MIRHERVLAVAASIAVAGRIFLPEIALTSATPAATATTTTAPTASPTPTPNYRAAIQAIRIRLSRSNFTLVSTVGTSGTATAYYASKEYSAAVNDVSAARDEIRQLLPQTGTLGQARARYLNALELMGSSLSVWPYSDGARFADLTSRAQVEWDRGNDLLP